MEMQQSVIWDCQFLVNKIKMSIMVVFYLMSPEVLKHEPYTQKSDIYSFGILMTEISTGLSPFHDYKKEDLAVSILNGFRPGFAENTPSFYIQLAKRCMDFNPEKRPTAKEAKDIVEFWYLAFSNADIERRESVFFDEKE